MWEALARQNNDNDQTDDLEVMEAAAASLAGCTLRGSRYGPRPTGLVSGASSSLEGNQRAGTEGAAEFAIDLPAWVQPWWMGVWFDWGAGCGAPAGPIDAGRQI